MFSPAKPFSSFSVNDLDAARAFYGDTLGLEVVIDPEMESLIIALPTGGYIFVYSKPNHTAASFTVLNFAVEDVEAAVDDLNGRGVVTKIYDDPELGTDEKGIARGAQGGPDIAWFKDPAGNVIAVMRVDEPMLGS